MQHHGYNRPVTKLLLFLAIPAAGFIGFLIGRAVGRRDAKGTTAPKWRLNLMLSVDCTEPIVISATGQDREGNTVTIPVDQLKLAAQNAQGNFGVFGTMEGKTFVERDPAAGESHAFNPGDAGATGTITGEVDIDGTAYTDSVDLTLAVGALKSIKLNLTPVADATAPVAPEQGGTTTTPADTTGGGTSGSDTTTVAPSEVGDASAVVGEGAAASSDAPTN